MAIGQTTQYSRTINNTYNLIMDSNGMGWYMAGPMSSDPASDWVDITGTSDITQTFRFVDDPSSTLDLDTSGVWKELSDRMKNIEENIKEPCVYCGRDFQPDPKYPGECIRCGGPRHVEISSEELKDLAKRVAEELEAIRAERERLQREREIPSIEVPHQPSIYEGWGAGSGLRQIPRWDTVSASTSVPLVWASTASW